MPHTNYHILHADSYGWLNTLPILSEQNACFNTCVNAQPPIVQWLSISRHGLQSPLLHQCATSFRVVRDDPAVLRHVWLILYFNSVYGFTLRCQSRCHHRIHDCPINDTAWWIWVRTSHWSTEMENLITPNQSKNHELVLPDILHVSHSELS